MISVLLEWLRKYKGTKTSRRQVTEYIYENDHRIIKWGCKHVLNFIKQDRTHQNIVNKLWIELDFVTAGLQQSRTKETKQNITIKKDKQPLNTGNECYINVRVHVCL